MAEGGREAVRVDDEVIGATSVRQLEKRIPRARAPLGPQDPRGRDPEEALAAALAKKPLSRWPSPDADGSR
jgi:transposase